MWGYSFARLKRRSSIRGVVMLVLGAVVAGLAVATLRYQPAPPVEIPAPTRPAATVIPGPPPGPVLQPVPVAAPSPAPSSTPPKASTP